MDHKTTCVVVLTYDNPHKERFNNEYAQKLENSDLYTLNYKQITKYREALAKDLQRNEGTTFRYAYCGEYGKNNNNPHYHMVFYGLSKKEHQIKIEKYWKAAGGGAVLWDKKERIIDIKAMSYVAQYVNKKLYNDKGNDYYLYEQKQPEALRTSSGIGKNQALLKRNEYKKWQYRYGTGKATIPRSYIKYYRKQDLADMYNHKKGGIWQERLTGVHGLQRYTLAQRLIKIHKAGYTRKSIRESEIITNIDWDIDILQHERFLDDVKYAEIKWNPEWVENIDKKEFDWIRNKIFKKSRQMAKSLYQIRKLRQQTKRLEL